ncbi:MAG: lytic transglycosylase domain-containing protein, partial [Caulobacterales bacterium]
GGGGPSGGADHHQGTESSGDNGQADSVRQGVDEAASAGAADNDGRRGSSDVQQNQSLVDQIAAIGKAQASVDPADVAAAARSAGVDPDFYARIINQESGGRDIVGANGARGPAQLTPATAKAMGVDPGDPQQNLKGGAQYLRYLLDRYHGDQRLAAAAYNAGTAAVDKYGGVPPNRETQHYVNAVTSGGPPP